MLWHSNRVLEKFSKLEGGDARAMFEPGARVARGFSDVGYEEFGVLPNGKLLSLFTGSLSEPDERERGFFVRVLDADELLDIAARRGVRVGSIHRLPGGRWRFGFELDGTSAEVESGPCESLVEAILDLLDVARSAVNERRGGRAHG